MAASIRPLHDRVLIKRIEEQELPDTEEKKKGAGMPMPVGEWTTGSRLF
ncbi:MAG TPA: hypothetical protein VFP47_06345 [Pyrinomonadaceae bacterium]|nr:hypothetical protein [Pyrinomonadaceae bacterium]